MFRFSLVLSILSICSARPNEKSPQNVVTVPPNCPEGQEWINGACRDVWFSVSTPLPLLKTSSDNIVDVQSMITVPPNCPPGQKWINGQCRDVWRGVLPTFDSNFVGQNMVTVPPNCPPGQQWINGQCRDVWRGGALADSEDFKNLLEKLWVKSDYAQISRQIEEVSDNTLTEFERQDDSSRNIISVPKQCPEGYKLDALGICRREF